MLATILSPRRYDDSQHSLRYLSEFPTSMTTRVLCARCHVGTSKRNEEVRMITRNVFRRFAILGLILALSSALASTAIAQNEENPGINAGYGSPICSTNAHGTTIAWQGNKVLSILTDREVLAVKQVNRADFGTGLVTTVTLPACNIGFTPNFDAQGCTTGPQIQKHAATAGLSPNGTAAINASDNALWKYFAGYGEGSNDPSTVLYRISCPNLSPSS